MAYENEINYLPDDPNDPGDPGNPGTPPPTTAGGFGTLVFNKAFTKYDASSALDITVYLNLYSADDLRFSAYLFIDDSLVQVGTTNALYDQANSQAQGTMTIPAIIEGVGAGGHTFSVRVKNRENEATLTVQAGSLFKITELYQGAR